MRTNVINKLNFSLNNESTEETFSNPIDISDIISVCKEYSKLGWKVQSQVECIMEIGIDEAIKSNAVTVASLPHIKDFLQQISQNPYFGDACDQAVDCIHLIDMFEDTNPTLFQIAN